MAIRYRTAEKEESAKLAELIDIASGGAVEYLFHDLVSGMTPIQVLAYSLKNDYYPHSYRSAIVATDENDVVGMALSYPAFYHKITDEMRKFFPAERLAHFEDFYSSRIEKSWFIDALGVSKTYRRKGIGKKLVELTREKARENGYDLLSLIVFADNVPGLALYKHLGFEVVRKINLEGNQFIQHQDGCLLMRYNIIA